MVAHEDVHILNNERTIEYIRREYAARRIYLDNRERYGEVNAAIDALRAGGEYLASLPDGPASGDAMLGELELLKIVEDGRLSLLSGFVEGCGMGPDIIESVHHAYSLSAKYGYVVSDMRVVGDGYLRRAVLLQVMYRESDKGKGEMREALSHTKIPDGWSLECESQSHDVRFFGENGLPWQRAVRVSKVIAGESYEGVASVFPEYSCSVRGIDAVDFSYEATVAKIAIDICDERIRWILLRKLDLSDNVFQLFKDVFPSDEWVVNKYSIDSIFSGTESIDHVSYVEHLPLETKDVRLEELVRQLRSGSRRKKEYENILKRNKELSSELRKIVPFLKKHTEQLFAGRYRPSLKETPRFVGLYLWDLVEIEGMKLSSAAKKFNDDYRSLFGSGYASEGSNWHAKLYKVTDRCIRGGVFLPVIL